MREFLVGGAVRDELLGRPVKDRDWVVVGATVQDMLDRGFSQVGADFPVFLHPDSKEEFALARQERKTAPGYHGFETRFDPDVTIEEDLFRRDLTINAMAKDEEGNLIDPFNGQEDLENGVLRHVSEAFAEDPVRVLRVARFAARCNFDVHADTMQLISPRVRVLYPKPGRSFSDTMLYDEAAVSNKYGVKPEHIADFKGLVGDIWIY